MNELRGKIWLIEQEVRIGNLSETDATDRILVLIREAGYVKEAKDQSLPEIPMSLRDYDGYERCKQDMLDAGWRKVKLGGPARKIYKEET